VYGDDDGLLVAEFSSTNANLLYPPRRMVNIRNLVYASASMKWVNDSTFVLLDVDTHTPKGLLLEARVGGVSTPLHQEEDR
jgi:hypothetical protein